MDKYKFNLKDNEKKLILETIAFTEGNMSYAKDLLGVSKASLYRRIKTHNINLDVVNDIREYNGNPVKKGWRVKGE